MGLSDWTTYGSARMDPIDAYIDLAGEYNHVIQINRDISEAKARYQKRDVEYCFVPAITILVIVLLHSFQPV